MHATRGDHSLMGRTDGDRQKLWADISRMSKQASDVVPGGALRLSSRDFLQGKVKDCGQNNHPLNGSA